MKKSLKMLVIVILLLLTLANSAFAGEIFSTITGTWQGKKNTLNFSFPYKGDLYFGGNKGCMYGKYSHVAMARENTTQKSYTYTHPKEGTNAQQTVSGSGWTGLTIEATTTSESNDVISRDCHRFWFYDWAAEGYVASATSTNRNDAVTKAVGYSGSYDWDASFTSNTTWNCGKLVARAYKDATNGTIWLNSNAGNSIYYPDMIYFDNKVAVYTNSSAASELSLPAHALERLQMWKEKGVDTSDIQFELGIQKKGFGKYLENLEKETKIDKDKFKESIKEKYNINDEQYKQIINDARNESL